MECRGKISNDIPRQRAAYTKEGVQTKEQTLDSNSCTTRFCSLSNSLLLRTSKVAKFSQLEIITKILDGTSEISRKTLGTTIEIVYGHRAIHAILKHII